MAAFVSAKALDHVRTFSGAFRRYRLFVTSSMGYLVTWCVNYEEDRDETWERDGNDEGKTLCTPKSLTLHTINNGNINGLILMMHKCVCHSPVILSQPHTAVNKREPK